MKLLPSAVFYACRDGDSPVCDLNMAPLVPFPWRQRTLIVMRPDVQCNR